MLHYDDLVTPGLSKVLKDMKEIEGWPGAMDSLVPTIATNFLQEKMRIQGEILEIGVHHGKYFLLLNSFLKSGESSYALDLFSHQELNIDKSGRGDYEVFIDNMSSLSEFYERVTVKAVDSFTLSSFGLSELMNKQKIRIASVDGGHTQFHAYHDLKICAENIADGGVIIVDDYFSPHWAGVHVGVIKYLLAEGANIVPFCASSKKLFLTTRSRYQQYFDFMRENMKGFLSPYRPRISDYLDSQIVGLAGSVN